MCVCVRACVCARARACVRAYVRTTTHHTQPPTLPLQVVNQLSESHVINTTRRFGLEYDKNLIFDKVLLESLTPNPKLQTPNPKP